MNINLKLATAFKHQVFGAAARGVQIYLGGVGKLNDLYEEERDLDALLVKLVETMEEVGSSSGELVKMGKASRNKGHYLNKLTPPPPL
ncbi:hypothetical protein Tco_0810123 [Tanacetum coccineum]